MSSTTELLSWVFFNETCLAFVDDLKVLFPQDQRLTVAYASIKIVTASRKKVMQRAFHKCLGPYTERILARDAGFFMEHTVDEYKVDYKRIKADDGVVDEIKSLTSDIKIPNKAVTGESFFKKVVDTLKTGWTDMDEHNRVTIWKYMEQLVKLDGICAKRDARMT
jgi:hypothetical protein